MKIIPNHERWLWRLVRRVWALATAVRRLSPDEPNYRERVAFQEGVWDGRYYGPNVLTPYGSDQYDLAEAWWSGQSVGVRDFSSPNNKTSHAS